MKRLNEASEHITSIVPSDRVLYDGQKRVHYGNAWPYALLLGETLGEHGLGFKYRNGDTLVTVGMHEGHVCLLPHTEVDLEEFRELAAQLYEAVPAPLYVKGITGKEEQALSQHGFRSARHTVPPGLEEVILGDDHFPHVTLDVKKTLAACKVNIARNDPLRSFEIRNFDPQWANDVVLDWGSSNKSNIAGYLNINHTIQDRSPYFVSQYHVSNVPVGLFIAKQLPDDSVGLYVNIASRHITRGRSRHAASKLFLLDFLERLDEKGIRYVHWGGSETGALHRFKTAFKPVEATKTGGMAEYNPHDLRYKPVQTSPTENFLANQRFRQYPACQLVFGRKFVIEDDVYPVCEDSIQLGECLLREDFNGKSVADIGTGTGFLAWCAHEAGARDIDAVDTSHPSLHAAEQSLRGTSARVFWSDCFTTMPGRYDAIIAHLPYEEGTPTSDLAKTVLDPGFAFRQRFFQEAHEHLNPGGCIYTAISDYAGGEWTIRNFAPEFNLERIGGKDIDVYKLTPART